MIELTPEQKIRAIMKSPMKSNVSTSDVAVGMMSSTVLDEKVQQLLSLLNEEKIKELEGIESVHGFDNDIFTNAGGGGVLRLKQRLKHLTYSNLERFQALKQPKED